MNILHPLQPDPMAMVVHFNLADLPSRLHTCATPADSIDEDAEPAIFTATLADGRSYRPKGKTLQMLAALQDARRMTKAELGKIGGVPTSQVYGLLETAEKHGIVRRILGRPAEWEMT
jgi:hypothetical protein